MLFFCFSPIFLAVNALYIYEVCKWIDTLEVINRKLRKGFKIIFGIIWSICSVAIFGAFLIPYSVSLEGNPFLFKLRRILKQIGNYHLGVFIYTGMLFIIIFILRLFDRIVISLSKENTDIKELLNMRARKIRRAVFGIINIGIIVFITLWGVHNAKNIKVKNYDITVNKKVDNVDELKVVLAADLHMGYNIGCEQIGRMVELINNENADLVVIAGDIFDNEYEALDDPDNLCALLGSIKSKYGIYAVYGNHDVSEKIIGGFTFNWDEAKESDPRMDKLLEDANIKLLYDDFVTVCDDSLYLYGRPDYEKPGRGMTDRLSADEITAQLDLSKPVIVLDHEPNQLDELSRAGVDILLCGHTHDGQFFPMNLSSRYFTWENSAGLLKKDNMTNIVTSGVGVYGPNIRIGTDAEICSITVHFE